MGDARRVHQETVRCPGTTENTHERNNENIPEELRPLLAGILDLDSGRFVPSARCVEELGMDQHISGNQAENNRRHIGLTIPGND